MASVHIPFSINGDVGTHGSHGPIPYGQGGCPSPFFFFFVALVLNSGSTP
jgi:hypothetical protein